MARRHEIEGLLVLQRDWMASMVHEDYGALPSAEKDLARLVARADVSAPEERGLALQAFERLGNLLFERERFETAVEIFQGLMQVQGFRARAALALARAEMERSRHAEAIVALDAALDRADEAEATEIQRLRGECWLALGDSVRAARAFGGWKEESVR